ncbi:hypothetical protein ACHAWF_011850 [Thalassiosira exigua]
MARRSVSSDGRGSMSLPAPLSVRGTTTYQTSSLSSAAASIPTSVQTAPRGCAPDCVPTVTHPTKDGYNECAEDGGSPPANPSGGHKGGKKKKSPPKTAKEVLYNSAIQTSFRGHLHHMKLGGEEYASYEREFNKQPKCWFQ